MKPERRTHSSRTRSPGRRFFFGLPLFLLSLLLTRPTPAQSPDICYVPIELSYVGRQIACAVGVEHVALKNEIGPDYFIHTASVAGYNLFLQRIHSHVAGAESQVSITALYGKREGEQSAPGLNVTLKDALLKLAQNHEGAKIKPLVRFIVGMNQGAKTIYFEITESLRKHYGEDPRKWPIHVSVAQLALSIPLTWNHSKFILTDSYHLITGGHWFGNAYGEKPSVSDLSVQLSGEIGPITQKYFDRIYTDLAHTATLDAYCSWMEDSEKECIKSIPEIPPVQPPTFSKASVIGLSRGYKYERFGIWSVDFTADKGVLAALNAAKDHIYINQAGLTLRVPEYISEPDILYDALAEAVFKRKVEVKIVVSGRDDFNLMGLVPEDAYWTLRRHINRWGNRNGYNGNQIESAQCRIRIKKHLHISEGVSSNSAHQKYWSVDGEAFYVGSQNLYPSGFMTNFSSNDLFEYGVVIDHHERAMEAERSFFLDEWSRAVAIVEDRPYDCDAQNLHPPEEYTFDVKNFENAVQPIFKGIDPNGNHLWTIRSYPVDHKWDQFTITWAPILGVENPNLISKFESVSPDGYTNPKNIFAKILWVSTDGENLGTLVDNFSYGNDAPERFFQAIPEIRQLHEFPSDTPYSLDVAVRVTPDTAVLFEDDFDANPGNWILNPTVAISGGTLHTLNVQQVAGIEAMSVPTWGQTTFTLTADLKSVAGYNQSTDFQLQFNDQSNNKTLFVRWRIHEMPSSGTYGAIYITLYINGELYKESELLGIPGNPIALTSGEWGSVRVQVDEASQTAQFSVYDSGGNLLGSTGISGTGPISIGRLGVDYFWDNEDQEEVHLDNLMIAIP